MFATGVDTETCGRGGLNYCICSNHFELLKLLCGSYELEEHDRAKVDDGNPAYYQAWMDHDVWREEEIQAMKEHGLLSEPRFQVGVKTSLKEFRTRSPRSRTG
jgi:hypothetical protein